MIHALWNLSHCPATKAHASLRNCANSPEPSLLAFTQFGSRCRHRKIIDLKPSRICTHVRLKNSFLQNCMFDLRPMGRGFESHRRHCVVHVSES